MKTKQRILHFFCGHEKAINQNKKVLMQLQTDLRRPYFMSNKIEALVYFFETIYPFSSGEKLGDLASRLEMVNYGQLDELVLSLKSLQKEIDSAWKDEMNETIERHTPDKTSIYLPGNFKGIKRRSAEFILKNRDELESNSFVSAGDSLIPRTNTWEKLSFVAQEFTDNKTKKMLEHLEIIEKWCE